MPVLKNARHELFTQNWFKGETKEKSAIIAGYKPSRAPQTASRLVKNGKVIARYTELQGQLEDKAVMDKLEILKTHTEIARGRIGHLLDESQRIKQGADLNNAAIQELDTSDIRIGRGENARLATITKIKLHDPVRSMQEIAKLRGFYPKEGTGEADNRVINFILSNGESKNLIEGIAKRLSAGDEDATEG